MNPNMSIYRRLNPRLLVQVALELDLLHWVNMSNISLTTLMNFINIMQFRFLFKISGFVSFLLGSFSTKS